jgi:hypothetical protein
MELDSWYRIPVKGVVTRISVHFVCVCVCVCVHARICWGVLYPQHPVLYGI